MSAIISSCGRYRYRLERHMLYDAMPSDVLAQDGPMVFVMANPSTADATDDDPTIRKCKGFALRHGRRHLIVVNVMAWRSTYPKELLAAPDPMGPENERYVRAAAATPDALIVVAWGEAIKRPLRHFTLPVIDWLRQHNDVHCFGLTDTKQPRHPLMLAYSTPLEIYARRSHAPA